MKTFAQKTKLENPKTADFSEYIGVFEKSFYIRDIQSLQPIPIFSFLHGNGLPCPIYSSRKSAAEMQIEMQTAYELDLEVTEINGIWDFFLLCAEAGLCGVVHDNSISVTFFNRLSDLNRDLPTLMWMRFPDSKNDLKGFFFSRRRVVETKSGTTVRWLNQLKFDKVINKYVLHGAPLRTNLNAHAIFQNLDPNSTSATSLINPHFLDGCTFLGPYVSEIGAVPIFSSFEFAQQFAIWHGLNVSQPPQKGGEYQVVKVKLFDFLNEIYEKNSGFVDIGLNPLMHRCDQGWFFRKEKNWMMETLSGVWGFKNGDAIPSPEVTPPKGVVKDIKEQDYAPLDIDTVVKIPFKRLLGSNRSHIPIEDAEEIAIEQLDLRFEPLELEDVSSPPIDSFLIRSFDKVTGDILAFSTYTGDDSDMGFFVFEDLITCLSYLYHEVMLRDEAVRIDGAMLCNGGGVEGSKDKNREKNITNSIKEVFLKIIIDALTKGYRPSHSSQIKRLINDATATIQIIDIGYFQDLVFYGLSDGTAIEDNLDEVSDNRKKQVGKITEARTKISKSQNYTGHEIDVLRQSLGKQLDLLTDDSKTIAVTALKQFHEIGKQAKFDYAGVSMMISKIVEREIKHKVFNKWIMSAKEEIGKSKIREIKEQSDQEDFDVFNSTLLNILNKKRRTDLGTVRFVLQRMGNYNAENSRLLEDNFLQFMKKFENFDWLVSEDFTSKIYDIYTKYRNGGVHEHLVSYEVCKEAIDTILLGKNPLLISLMKSTVIKSN